MALSTDASFTTEIYIREERLVSKHTSNQTFTGLRHDVVVHGILPHVVTNIVSGYFDVFKNRGHLGKLGLHSIRDVKIDFQSTKSPLLKWYVEHGLKVTQIHQVVEYTPATCFQKFGEQVSEARRAGRVDEIAADVMLLTVNDICMSLFVGDCFPVAGISI
jgi:hypothetical protein